MAILDNAGTLITRFASVDPDKVAYRGLAMDSVPVVIGALFLGKKKIHLSEDFPSFIVGGLIYDFLTLNLDDFENHREWGGSANCLDD